MEPWQSSQLSLTEEPHLGQGRRVVLAGDAAPVMGSMDVAARLTAAKPVRWRGRSDLPQYPWAKPFRGTWLVVDLWAGVGGLCVALLAMGVHFYALSAESDEDAVRSAEQAMPNLVHLDRVEDVRADHFRGLLQRRHPRGILIGGGRLMSQHRPSCLPLSTRGTGQNRTLVLLLKHCMYGRSASHVMRPNSGMC